MQLQQLPHAHQPRERRSWPSAAPCPRPTPQQRRSTARRRAYSREPSPREGRFAGRYQDDSDTDVVQTRRALPQASSRFQGLRVAVVGAAGGTGRRVVEYLVEARVPVRAIARDTAVAAGRLPPSGRDLEIVQGNVYQFASLKRALGDSNAVIIASGARPSLGDPLGPFNVDYQGVENVVAAAKQAGVKKVVLVSSIGVDDVFFPLNLAFGVLFWKKRGEESLQRSGLDYTIIRPGGLLNAPKEEKPRGEVVLKGPDTFGLPPRQTPGSILRAQVAELCAECLVLREASNKVVEAVAVPGRPRQSLQELFAEVA